MEDKKALKILFDAYWSPNGWKNGEVNTEDYFFAKQEGYMFEPIMLHHDEIISSIKSKLIEIEKDVISNAFLFSLSTRKLEYRSALGSYIIANSMPLHKYEELLAENRFCGICSEFEKIDINRNVLNFERYKWGGVRHLKPEYILFDLEQFIKLTPVFPSSGDFKILSNIIETVYQLDEHANVRDLEKSLGKVFKSNKAEREVLIQILCYCSILENPEYPGFNSYFTHYLKRPDPVEHKNDWSYPSFKWKAKFRINKKALNDIFPDYS